MASGNKTLLWKEVSVQARSEARRVTAVRNVVATQGGRVVGGWVSPLRASQGGQTWIVLRPCSSA